jgi:hypothetical protein
MNICLNCRNNNYIFINDCLNCFIQNNKNSKENILLALKFNSYNIFKYLITNYRNEISKKDYLKIIELVLTKKTKYLEFIKDIIQEFKYETLIILFNDLYNTIYTNNILYLINNIDYSELNYKTVNKLLCLEILENIDYSHINIYKFVIQNNIIELIDFYFNKIQVFLPEFYNYVNNFNTFIHLLNNNYIFDSNQLDTEVSLSLCKDIRIIRYLIKELKINTNVIDRLFLEYFRQFSNSIDCKKLYIYYLSRYDDIIYQIINIQKWTLEDYNNYKLYVLQINENELLNSLKNFFIKKYENNKTFRYAFKLLENSFSIQLINIKDFCSPKYFELLYYIINQECGYITFNRKINDILRYEHIQDIRIIKLMNKYNAIEKYNSNIKNDIKKLNKEYFKNKSLLHNYKLYEKCEELLEELFII